MADTLQTVKVPCRGGLDTNLDIVQQGDTKPGSAIRLVNYEVSLSGGYRRVSGYTYLDNTYQGPNGTGPVLGVCVFNSLGVIAARKPSSGNNYIYKYTAGVGWTAINTHTPTFTGVTKTRFFKFNWTGDTIGIVDGVNRLQLWNGTTWTDVNTTNSPVAPKYATEFRNHIFVSSGNSILKFSGPLDAAQWQSAHGGGEINVGFPIVGIKAFRDALFIFGKNAIKKLTGSALANFVVAPVTTNLGCIASDSILEIAGDIYFLAPDGIRPIAATDRVDDVEIETVSKPIQQLLQAVPDLYNLDDICNVVIRGKSQFRYFFSQGENATGIMGALRLGEAGIKWEFGELLGINASCADSDYIAEEEYVIHGDSTGKVYRQESGTSFNGENIVSIYQTPWLDMGDTPIRKNPHKVWTFIRSEGDNDIKLSLSYNWSDTEVLNPANYTLTYSGIAALYNTAEYDASAEYDGIGSPVLRTSVEGSGYSVSLQYVTFDTNPSHHIQGYLIEYQVGDRR